MIYEAFDILTGKGIPVSNIYSEVYFWIEAPLNLPEGEKKKGNFNFCKYFQVQIKVDGFELWTLNFLEWNIT
jgi:hypothetical protein